VQFVVETHRVQHVPRPGQPLVLGAVTREQLASIQLAAGLKGARGGHHRLHLVGQDGHLGYLRRGVAADGGQHADDLGGLRGRCDRRLARAGLW
jgi:hypothetical protein